MIFTDFSQFRIFLKTGITDLRKSINTLSILVEKNMDENIFEKSLFIFCNRRKNLVKILYWDINGFCIWMKKLEKDKLPWLQSEDAKREINSKELELLLSGIDFFKAHKKLNYLSVT
ncbi:MAG: IS66 family insertion sequence element accessory protein TnpB [Spirochaetia bacterium]|nr:IS66 family insertion sequence element accessory protein TnpB [Spirochaetia bacterium]